MSPRVRGLMTWAGVFVLLVLLKRNALLLPASWDESWAVLPGGLWLAENNLDIAGLLDQPQLFYYGPGTYPLAPITWMTGIVAALTTTTKSFLISLHLTHMAIGAVGLREVYRFARPVWSPTASAGLVVVTALVPVMNAQLGFMYLEIPIFTAGMLTVNAGLTGRWGRAAAWGALATSFKASGILPVSAIVGACLITQRRLIAARTAVLTLLPSLAVGMLPLLLKLSLVKVEKDPLAVFSTSVIMLIRMPELAVAIGFATLFLALPDRTDRPQSPETDIRLKVFPWILLTFVAFYTVIYFAVPLYVLPRYFIILVPFAFFAAWEVGRSRFGSVLRTAALVTIVISMFANSSSSLIRSPRWLSSVALEASNIYAPRLLVTQELLDSALSTDLPVYVVKNTWFRTQYPDLGYVQQIPSNVHLVTDLDLLDPPDRLVIVESPTYPEARDAIEVMTNNLAYQSEVVEFTRSKITERYLIFRRTPS